MHNLNWKLPGRPRFHSAWAEWGGPEYFLEMRPPWDGAFMFSRGEGPDTSVDRIYRYAKAGPKKCASTYPRTWNVFVHGYPRQKLEGSIYNPLPTPKSNTL